MSRKTGVVIPLEEVRAAKDLFKPEDFSSLERVFRFQELWGNIWKDHTVAYFLRRMGQLQDWSGALRPRLERVLDHYTMLADQFEKDYGPDVFPRSPKRARQYIADIRKELAAIK